MSESSYVKTKALFVDEFIIVSDLHLCLHFHFQKMKIVITMSFVNLMNVFDYLSFLSHVDSLDDVLIECVFVNLFVSQELYYINYICTWDYCCQLYYFECAVSSAKQTKKIRIN